MAEAGNILMRGVCVDGLGTDTMGVGVVVVGQDAGST